MAIWVREHLPSNSNETKPEVGVLQKIKQPFANAWNYLTGATQPHSEFTLDVTEKTPYGSKTKQCWDIYDEKTNSTGRVCHFYETYHRTFKPVGKLNETTDEI